MAFNAAVTNIVDAFLSMFIFRLALVVAVIAGPVGGCAGVTDGTLPTCNFVIHREGMSVNMDITPATCVVAF